MSETPAFLPRARIACSERCRLRPDFDVHGDHVGAGLGERLQIGVARRDHQMDVEDLVGMRPQRLHDVGADGDIGHKVAVHDIDMDPVGPGHIDRADLFTQFGEVGGQNRRGDDQRAAHRFLANFVVRLTRPRGWGNPAAPAVAACDRNPQELTACRICPPDRPEGTEILRGWPYIRAPV